MTRPVHLRTAEGAVRTRLSLSPTGQVWMLVGGMCLLLLAVFAALPWPTEALRASPWWVVIVLIAANAAAERMAFDVEIGNEGHSFSVSELPLAFGVVFLSPALAIVARVAGAAAMMYGPRRIRGVKLVFNVVLFAIEVLIAALVAQVMVDWWSGDDAVLLVGTMIGVFVASSCGGLAVALAASRFEGSFLERIRVDVVSLWWFYCVSTIFAAMGVALALISPWLAPAILPAVWALWFVMRSVGLLNQELRDLDAVHGFAGRVGGSLDVEEIAQRGVVETAELLRADGAALLRLNGTDVVVRTSGHVPIRLPTTIDDPVWDYLATSDRAHLLGAGGLREMGAVTDGRLKHVMVAPILDDSHVFGLLLATENDAQRVRFTEADRARLRNMADQLAISLRRGLLHERLEYEARHDALTDLPARTLFEREVTDALARPHDDSIAVMMLDLDRFKEVNDTLGHHAGDALLIEFSQRMSALLGPGDLLARLAGDEFAILCRRQDADAVVDVARSCVEVGGRPVVLDGLEIVVTVSVGVAFANPNETDPLQPMRRADIAMYNAKWQRTGVEVYRDEIDRRTPARLSMLGDLRAAIEGGDVVVVYQPQLDLRTREVAGVEALVRWNSPSRGIVAPTEFVRVAEDTGLIKDLTDLVLEHGISGLQRLNESGLDLRLAVNLSTHDLFDTKLPDRVLSRLHRHGMGASALTLEITESSLLVDAPRTRATIDDLHDAGFRLAVDDFGTGYSSLSYLRRLPVHELKIDHSFVTGMLRDPQDEVIVKSTIDLGHNLQLSVVAEGVEDDATLRALCSMGCDVAQGFGIARPLSARDLVESIGRARRRPARVPADVGHSPDR